MRICVHCLSPLADSLEPISFGPLILRQDSCVLSFGEKSVKIQPRRSLMLAAMMRDPRPHSDKALHELYPGTEIGIVKVHICRLRQHLAALDAPVSIRLMPSGGYSLVREGN